MFYNKEIKEQFIKQYTENEGSIKVITSLFNQIGKIEERYEKDLVNFASDIRDVYLMLISRTNASIESKHSIIKSYCDWAIKNGYSKTNINPTIFIDRKDLLGFVSVTAQKFQYIMSRDDLYEILDNIYNARDKAVVALLFEGIRGRANKEDSFEEILNLKRTNFDLDNNVVECIRNDGQTRPVKVDPRTMKYVIDAFDATEYYQGNGEHTRGARTPLLESDYLLRSIKTENAPDKPLRSMVTNIFRVIKLYTDMPFINAEKVFQSGMLVTCAEMEEEKKTELTMEDYTWIVEQKFGQQPTIAFSLKQKYMKFKKLTETSKK
jgi:integrase